MKKTPVKFKEGVGLLPLPSGMDSISKKKKTTVSTSHGDLEIVDLIESPKNMSLKSLYESSFEESDVAKRALASCGNIKSTHKAVIIAAINKMLANASKLYNVAVENRDLSNQTKEIDPLSDQLLILKADHARELYEQEKRHSDNILKMFTINRDQTPLGAEKPTAIRLSTVEKITASKSYAQATSGKILNKSPIKAPVIEKLFSIVVSGKSPIASEVLENTLKKNINVTSLGIGIKKIKKLANNKIVIQCDTEEQCSKYKAEVSKIQQLKCQKGVKIQPKLILKGIAADISDKEIVLAIINQNSGFSSLLGDKKPEEVIKVLHKLPFKKDGSRKCAVISVVPQAWRFFSEKKVLNVGYYKVGVSEYLALISCQKCMGYGHSVAHCKSKQVCWRCGGDHKIQNCPTPNNGTICCQSCVAANKMLKLTKPVNHMAHSMECPIYSRNVVRYRSLVDYGCP